MKRKWNVVGALLVTLLVAGTVGNFAYGNHDPYEGVEMKKISLCHDESGDGTSYHSSGGVSVNSVINGGHGNHETDIIPPFHYKNGSYAGLNWTSENQTYWEENCNGESEEEPELCEDEEANNQGQELPCTYDEGDVPGCTDEEALNFNENATIDDGSCDYPDPNEETVSLTLCKQDEQGNPLPGWTMQLHDNLRESIGDQPDKLTGEDGCVTYENLPDVPNNDIWEAFEVIKTGWDFVSVSCDPEDSVFSGPHFPPNRAGVAVEMTEDVTCTFINKLEGNNEEVDVCTNIVGIQIALPDDHHFASAGICVPNDGGGENDNVTVTIVKYIDDATETDIHATGANTSNASFALTSTWDADNIGAGSGNFSLGLVGFNNPNAYEATTSEMTSGADYSVVENNVLTSCSEQNEGQYMLVGYKLGDTLEGALASSVQSGATLTNISTDKVIVVINRLCGEVEGAVCDANVNLLQNGGFEAPAVSAGNYSIVPDSDAMLKWLAAWITPQTTGTLGLELQNNIAGTPSEGNQLAELDGDHPVRIWQDIATIVGEEYTLTFDYSARPGVGAGDNDITVKIDGSVAGAVLSDDGTGDSNTAWGNYSRTFTATDTTTTIEFVDGGTDNSFGGYLDNAKVSCVPEGDGGDDGDDGDEEEDGVVHIFKYVDGVQATSEAVLGASFPMFTSTFSASFTLDSDGWTTGDAPYEASTSSMSGGANYTFNEDLSTFVGASCTEGKTYALAGYTMGADITAAQNGVLSLTPPNITVDGDTYVIVWNTKCVDGIGGEDDVVTQCNDTVDNNDEEDLLADANDPGCHTDGDADNVSSYDPNDNDETNVSNGGGDGDGGGGDGATTRSGSRGTNSGGGTGDQGDVLGLATTEPGQVLGEAIGLPRTGSGGNAPINIILLIISGSVAILGGWQLKKAQ